MTPTDRTDRAAHDRAKPNNRAWYQSIAGKLLLAFGLIVALTVGATWLSLIRFNQVDAVMHRLTDGSLPAVKLALGVEFDRQGRDRDRDRGRPGGERNRALAADGRAVQPDDPAVGASRRSASDRRRQRDRIPAVDAVSSIDSVVYDLNQTTADAMALADSRRKSIARLAGTTRKALDLVDGLAGAIAADAPSGEAQGAEQQKMALLRAVADLRADLTPPATRSIRSPRPRRPASCSHCAASSTADRARVARDRRRARRRPSSGRQDRRDPQRDRCRARAPGTGLGPAVAAGTLPRAAARPRRPSSRRCRRSATSCAPTSATWSPTPSARPPAPPRCRRAPSRPAASGCC